MFWQSGYGRDCQSARVRSVGRRGNNAGELEDCPWTAINVGYSARLSRGDDKGTTATHPHEIRNRIDAWGTRNHHSPGNWANGTITTDTWLSEEIGIVYDIGWIWYTTTV